MQGCRDDELFPAHKRSSWCRPLPCKLFRGACYFPPPSVFTFTPWSLSKRIMEVWQRLLAGLLVNNRISQRYLYISSATSASVSSSRRHGRTILSLIFRTLPSDSSDAPRVNLGRHTLQEQQSERSQIMRWERQPFLLQYMWLQTQFDEYVLVWLRAEVRWLSRALGDNHQRNNVYSPSCPQVALAES